MAFFPKFVLPADYLPRPVHASGMMALSESNKYKYAITLRNTAAVQQNFNFGGDGKLPWADIDAFRGSNFARVLQRSDQIGGVPGFNTDYVTGSGNAPRVSNLTIGTERCMWMESDCQTDNLLPVDGNVEFMRADNIGTLNILQNSVAVMQVVQVHNSAYNNQVSGPFNGTMFALGAFDGVSALIPHTKLMAEWLYRFDVNQTAGGGIVVEDGLGFRMRNVGDWIETSPFVLTYVMGGTETYVGKNEDFRSIAAQSAGTRTAVNAFIGCHESSLSHAPKPPQDGLTDAMGMAELLTMIWKPAPTLRQLANVRASVYTLCGINRLHSHSNKPLIALFNDSIWAGYKAKDLRGWDKKCAKALPSDVRWANFAVPGAGYIFNPASPFVSSGAVRQFPGFMAQAIRQHRGRVCCILGASVNDFYDGTVTAAQVYKEGFLKMIEMIRAVDPTAKIIGCTGTHSSNATTDMHLLDTGNLILAGAAANGYEVVDIRSDPFMSNVALACEDGSHLSEMGCAQWDFLMRPSLTAWLQSLGPY